jgi:isoleucyl-tRNA synthetase
VDAYGIIRKLCYTSITDPEMDHVLENFNPMLAIQGVNGRVTNAVMDTLNICKLPDGEHKDRDYLTFCQQGPMVITHAETRAREIAWGNRKEVAKVASERAKAEALIAKNAEKVAKEAADKVEKERLKAMTPAARKLDPATMEKARVAKEKREKSAAAKKEKETLDAQNLAAAIELVA